LKKFVINPSLVSHSVGTAETSLRLVLNENGEKGVPPAL